MLSCLINGEESSSINAADRGLHYGDGLFETVVVRDGLMPLWDRHWRRLSQSCQRLGLQGVDEVMLRDEALRLCAGLERGVLKVIITRGVGGRGYRPSSDMMPTRLLATYPWPDYPDAHRRDGVTVRWCETRLGRNRTLAGMKHLNRLEQVLARSEWNDPDIAEGLMCDDQGHVISGTMSNLFMVQRGELLTPSLKECGVAGVMRGVIMEQGLDGLIFREADISTQALLSADEVFLCNALFGIWPVRRIADRDYPIGPVTRRLVEFLRSTGLTD